MVDANVFPCGASEVVAWNGRPAQAEKLEIELARGVSGEEGEIGEYWLAGREGVVGEVFRDPDSYLKSGEGGVRSEEHTSELQSQ